MMNKFVNYLKSGNFFVLILVFAILFASIPIFSSLNSESGMMLNEESHYFVRMISQYRFTDVYFVDALLDRDINFSFYFYLLGKSSLPMSFIIYILPVLLGVICVWLFDFLLGSMGFNDKHSLFFVLVFLVSSPLFIFIFSTVNPVSLYLVFFLVGLILFVKRSYWSLFFSLFLGLFDFLLMIFFLGFLVVYTYWKHNNWRLFFSNFLSGIIGVLILVFWFGFDFSLILGLFNSSVENILVSFGGVGGFSSILIVLCVLGMFIAWKRSFEHFLFYVFVFFLFICSIYFDYLRIIFVLVACFYSGIAVSGLIVKKWSVPNLKEVTLLLVFCSIIFASIIFLRAEMSFSNSEYGDAFAFLGMLDSKKVIFGSERDGFMIQNLGNKRTFWDARSFLYEDYSEKIIIANKLYYSRNLKEVETLLVNNNVEYIFVNKEMFNGRIWNSRDEGALFLYRNSNKFSKVFENEVVEIFRYVG